MKITKTWKTYLWMQRRSSKTRFVGGIKNIYMCIFLCKVPKVLAFHWLQTLTCILVWDGLIAHSSWKNLPLVVTYLSYYKMVQYCISTSFKDVEGVTIMSFYQCVETVLHPSLHVATAPFTNHLSWLCRPYSLWLICRMKTLHNLCLVSMD